MEKSSPHRRYLREFCSLSIRILRLGNLGVPKREFLLRVSDMLIRFSGCDAVGLCLHRGEQASFWQVRPDGSGGLQIERLLESETMSRVCAASDGQARRVLLEGEPYRSLLVIPFSVDESEQGVLSFRSRRADFSHEREIEFYEGLGHTLGVAISDRRAQAALRERVKELTCLYGISQITRHPGLALEDTLRRIVETLPPAFQHPEAAVAAIRLDQRSFTTPGFRGGPWVLRSPIRVNGDERGAVEVGYLEDRAEPGEEPFLPEERNLIEGVAKQISLLLEGRQAEENQRRLEEQLRHADRLATIGELAAGVAHELNEPLGNILGFAQLAQKTPQLPGQAEQDLERIVQASLHAREVVKKLLIFARRLPTRKSRIDLNQTVREGLYFLESRCRKEGIELHQELTAGLPPIVADPSQLHQVLVNLMVNSLQAMPGGGRLTVRTRSAPAGVALEVEDTGTGMSESIRQQIFIPFFTTKEVGQGTGLGLAVVHGIVTSHGGVIEVDSDEGRGSRFTILLPAGGTV